MDAAFQLVASPASAAGVGSGSGDRRAGLAADAGIAAVIELKARYAMFSGVGFDLKHGPISKNRDLFHLLASRGSVIFDLLKVSPGWRLIAAQTGEPPVIRFKRPHERLDFAHLAALGGLDDMKFAILAFVLFEAQERHRVDEIEVPIGCNAVAVGEELWEVIAGFEEDDGDVRGLLAEKVEDDHVFSLEAGGEAERSAVGFVEDMGDEFGGSKGFGSVGAKRSAMVSRTFMRAPRKIAPIGFRRGLVIFRKYRSRLHAEHFAANSLVDQGIVSICLCIEPDQHVSVRGKSDLLGL